MNERQAATLKAVIEAGHPDAAVTVTAHPGGAEIAISGAVGNPGLSGPGGSRDVVLRTGENSPFLRFFLARAAAQVPACARPS